MDRQLSLVVQQSGIVTQFGAEHSKHTPLAAMHSDVSVHENVNTDILTKTINPAIFIFIFKRENAIIYLICKFNAYGVLVNPVASLTAVFH